MESLRRISINLAKNHRKAATEIGGFLNLFKLFKAIAYSKKRVLIPILISCIVSGMDAVVLVLMIPASSYLMGTVGIIPSKLPSSSRLLNYVSELVPSFNEPSTVNNVTFIFFALIGLILFRAIIRYLYSYICFLESKKILNSIRDGLFVALFTFKKDFYDKRSSGQLVHTVMSEPNSIAGNYSSILNQIFNSVVGLGYGIVLLIVTPRNLIFLGVILIFLELLTKRITSTLNALSVKLLHKSRTLAGRLQDYVNGISFIRATSGEGASVREVTGLTKELYKVEKEAHVRSSVVGPLQEAVQSIVVLGVMYILWKGAVKNGPTEFALYGVIIFAVRRFLTGVASFSNLRLTLTRIQPGLQSILWFYSLRGQTYVEKNGSKRFNNFKKSITFENVSFSYLKEGTTLKNINLKIQKGTKVAIVGSSGSGKSTLLQLMLRLYDPNNGIIKVDGINLKDIDVTSYRKSIGFVSQDIPLFDLNFRENLIFGLEVKVSHDVIQDAIQTAQLSEMLKKYPEGLETKIGERGLKLSGGEKQRLALARAIIRKPELLILDEPTSALDSETERCLEVGLNELHRRGMTVVIAAHRLSTIKDCERILVMNHGCLEEQGTLTELLALKGRFYKMWEMQKLEDTMNKDKVA
jgi:subfamily B ATP-binding cassette protein MsbA